MTTTENTTRPSNNITRRKMLQSVAVTSTVALAAAVLPTSFAVANDEAQVSLELVRLINDHRQAWVALGECCNAADDSHPSYGGAEAEAIWQIRNDAEQEALQLVLAFPIRSFADAQAKGSYLTSETFGLDEYDVETLLASMAGSEIDARQLVADPIVDAIDAFRDGLMAFDATPSAITDLDEDGAIARTYGAPMDVLMEWDRPAQTLAGAVAAIRLADEENIKFSGSVIAENMVRAASAYFSPRETRVAATLSKDTPIQRLYQQWKTVRDESDQCDTDEEAQAKFKLYAGLQEQITAMKPMSAKDMATQLVVETDFGDSDYRDVFFERVAALAEKP